MKSTNDAAPWAACPYCARVDLHPMRAPDPRAPVACVRVEDREEISIMTANGDILTLDRAGPKYDRDDERGFETVRECVHCDRSWGITPQDRE